MVMTSSHSGESLVASLRRTRRPEIERLCRELEAASREAWAQQCQRARDYLIASVSKSDAALEAMSARDSSRIDEYRGLAEVAMGFGSFAAMEEHVNRVRGKSGLTEVLISTIHKMKGDEADAVFVCGLKAGLFPHAKSLRSGDTEEELRLFYVACSRARDVLILSSGGPPSSFFLKSHRLLEAWRRHWNSAA
jgi:superfamily I DNA/RNA helicase